MTQGASPNLIPHTQLTLNEIFVGSLNSIRRMPKTLLGIGLFAGFLVGISTIVTSALIVRGGESLDLPQIPNPSSVITAEQVQELLTALGPTLKIGITTALVLFFIQAITSGMYTHIIGNAIIGKKINANESWQKSRPQLLRIILLSLLSFILPTSLLAVGLAIGIGLSTINSLFVFVGLGAGLLGAIYLWFGLFISIPVLVLEDLKLKMAVKRSFFLYHENILRGFGIGLFGIIASQAISIVVSTPFALLAQTGATEDPTTTSIFMSSMGSIIGYTFMLPFTAAFTTLLYTDLRIRKENIATELNKAAAQ